MAVQSPPAPPPFAAGPPIRCVRRGIEHSRTGRRSLPVCEREKKPCPMAVSRGGRSPFGLVVRQWQARPSSRILRVHHLPGCRANARSRVVAGAFAALRTLLGLVSRCHWSSAAAGQSNSSAAQQLSSWTVQQPESPALVALRSGLAANDPIRERYPWHARAALRGQ